MKTTKTAYHQWVEAQFASGTTFEKNLTDLLHKANGEGKYASSDQADLFEQIDRHNSAHRIVMNHLGTIDDEEWYEMLVELAKKMLIDQPDLMNADLDTAVTQLQKTTSY